MPEPAPRPDGGSVIGRHSPPWSRLGAGLAAALAGVLALTGPPASAATSAFPVHGARSPAAAGARTARAVSKASWQLKLATQYGPFTGHSQYVAVVAGPHDAWFFGGSNLGGHGAPEVAHRVGGRFRFPSLPPGLHSWIIAASSLSPRNIWAVTYLGGAVLHWNGTAWQTQRRGGWRTGTQFTGISAAAPGSVWLFGVGSPRYSGAGTWHWDGTGWTRVHGIAGGIRQASAASATDIWGIGGIGGSMNALLQLRGGAWRHITPSALTGFRYSDVFALAPGNVWVAGSVSGIPKLAHFNGSGWTRAAMPGSIAATGICRNGRGGLWAVANSGKGPSVLRQRSAAGSWSTATVSSSSANEVLACAVVPGRRAVWGAGKARPPLRGTAAAVYGYGSVP